MGSARRRGWFRIWDLGKPVIAQVHGCCLAGGSELAACCDLVYVAEDAQIGLPSDALDEPARQSIPPVAHGDAHGQWRCS